MSNAELSRQVDLAPSAVLQRVRRLEERGVIQGYLARIDPQVIDRALVAFVHLRTNEPLTDTSIPEQLSRVRGVLEVHDIAGEDCYLLKVRVGSTDQLHRLIREEIGVIPGVVSTRTTIVLKTFMERFDQVLPDSVNESQENEPRD